MFSVLWIKIKKIIGHLHLKVNLEVDSLILGFGMKSYLQLQPAVDRGGKRDYLLKEALI